MEKAGTEGREFIFADEIRITAFGAYALEHLCSSFTYIDLVSLDCGLTEEALYNEFCSMALKERAMGTASDKKGRLASRLEHSKKFVEYLRREEEREKTAFLLDEADILTVQIENDFLEDCRRAESSARRTFGKG